MKKKHCVALFAALFVLSAGCAGIPRYQTYPGAPLPASENVLLFFPRPDRGYAKYSRFFVLDEIDGQALSKSCSSWSGFRIEMTPGEHILTFGHISYVSNFHTFAVGYGREMTTWDSVSCPAVKTEFIFEPGRVYTVENGYNNCYIRIREALPEEVKEWKIR